VSRIIHPLGVYLTSIVALRIPVRSFGLSPRALLTYMPRSGPSGAEQLSPRTRSRVSSRQSPQLSQGNTRDCAERDRGMGQGLQTVSHLLAERARRDRQVHDCPDGQRAYLCWGNSEPLSSVPATLRTAATCTSSFPPSPSSWHTSSQNFDPFSSPSSNRIRILHTSRCTGRWRSW